LANVLLLFDSRGGFTEQLAEEIASGISSVASSTLKSRRVDKAAIEELKECDALILGSPN